MIALRESRAVCFPDDLVCSNCIVLADHDRCLPVGYVSQSTEVVQRWWRYFELAEDGGIMQKLTNLLGFEIAVWKVDRYEFVRGHWSHPG